MQIERSVTISGTLKTGATYKLCPPDEFSTGNWFMCISSITFNAKQAMSSCCEISSNFVVGQKYSNNYEVETYEEPLVTIFITAPENPKPRLGRIEFGMRIQFSK